MSQSNIIFSTLTLISLKYNLILSLDIHPVEYTRAETLAIEKVLWSEILIYNELLGEESTRNRLVKKVLHYNYGLVFNKDTPLEKTWNTDNFGLLKSHPKWRKRETHHIIASKVFVDFRNFLERVQNLKLQNSLDYVEKFLRNTLSSLDYIKALVSYDKEMSFVEQVHMTLQNDCSLTSPKRDYLIKFYNEQTLSELKVFIMVNTAWMVDHVLGKSNHIPSVRILDTQFTNYFLFSHSNFTHTLRATQNSFYRCDPFEPIENVTFHQLTNFDQAYAINELNMKIRNCNQECHHIKEAQYEYCDPENANYEDCGESPCRKFYDCEFKSESISTCKTDEQPITTHEFINYDASPKGRNCKGTYRTSRATFKYGSGDCNMCICYCDVRDESSDRIVSVQKLESNITANEVVTGLRMVKLNHIFYLQIQVGKLLPMKKIDQNTVRWIPIKEIKNYKYDAYLEDDYFVLHREARFDLDVFKFDDEVLTGARLQQLWYSVSPTHRFTMKFSARGTKVNFNDGILDKTPDKTSWHLRNENGRKLLNAYRRDHPVEEWRMSKRISVDRNDYIRFWHSSLTTDSGQTPVPFWDAQDVSFVPAVPLVGAGFYWKTYETSGGYVGPLIVPVEHQKYWDEMGIEQIDKMVEDYKTSGVIVDMILDGV